MQRQKKLSPTNRYVAMCDKSDFSGFYFKRFTIPQEYVDQGVSPSWYFLNRLNFVACVKEIITQEDFDDISDQE